MQASNEIQGERRVQPDPESVSKVFQFDVSLTETAPPVTNIHIYQLFVVPDAFLVA